MLALLVYIAIYTYIGKVYYELGLVSNDNIASTKPSTNSSVNTNLLA